MFEPERNCNCGTVKAAGVWLLLGLLTILTDCSSKSITASATNVITDEIGRTVHISPHPQRIISLTPSVTEILFAIGAGDRLIADTTYCTYPDAARTKEKIGDTQTPNLEKIIALKPDLVILSTASQLQEFTNRLSNLGIPVYVSDAKSLSDILKSIEDIAAAIGDPDAGKRVTDGLRKRISDVDKHVSGLQRPSVLFLVQEFTPLFTVGPGAFTTDVIQEAGGNSISRDLRWPNPYPQMSPEAAVAAKPEIIIFSDPDATQVTSSDNFPIAELKGTPAVISGRVYKVPAGHVATPGPRIVDGLEDLAHIFHPEAYK
ncbi:MAG TPA: cobalamin-binding protein [Blastocatellia bacterium]|nr:cobalamin-binding protein [Blastocatellia bacterium]